MGYSRSWMKCPTDWFKHMSPICWRLGQRIEPDLDLQPIAPDWAEHAPAHISPAERALRRSTPQGEPYCFDVIGGTAAATAEDLNIESGEFPGIVGHDFGCHVVDRVTTLHAGQAGVGLGH